MAKRLLIWMRKGLEKNNYEKNAPLLRKSVFMMEGAFTFNGLDVVPDEKLLPLTVFGIPIVADVRMLGQPVPFLHTFTDFFAGHDSAL